MVLKHLKGSGCFPQAEAMICLYLKNVFYFSLLQGYVPIHRFKFGGTYKEGTETAVTEFKMKDSNHRHEQLDLHLNTMSYPRLQIRKDFPPPDPSHPGTNLRYATAYYGKHFSKYFISFPGFLFIVIRKYRKNPPP